MEERIAQLEKTVSALVAYLEFEHAGIDGGEQGRTLLEAATGRPLPAPIDG